MVPYVLLGIWGKSKFLSYFDELENEKKKGVERGIMRILWEMKEKISKLNIKVLNFTTGTSISLSEPYKQYTNLASHMIISQAFPLIHKMIHIVDASCLECVDFDS